MVGHGRRGRPRPPAPLHLVASRELTAAMRQLRLASGDSTKDTVEVLNDTIAQLYPDAIAAAGRPAGRESAPHTITARYVLQLERGYHARLRVPDWLVSSGHRDDPKAYGSRVPPWLVRAYDVAFGADGYLVDTYRWAAALQADQQHTPPRATRSLPSHLPPGHEEQYLLRGFADATDEVRVLLREQAVLVRERAAREAREAAWWPSTADGSGGRGEGEDEAPEGLLLPPGGCLVVRWILYNTGTLPWRDRLLYRVGDHEAGIRTPPFLVVPQTSPGAAAELRCPVQAPERPGTYRACLKMGWPDGTYCFPNTLLGVIVTLVVPPADLADCHRPWEHR